MKIVENHCIRVPERVNRRGRGKMRRRLRKREGEDEGEGEGEGEGEERTIYHYSRSTAPWRRYW